MLLRHLRTFIAIADYGGFSAAGKVTGLTQSAVSLHIKRLEEAVDVELFDRTTRPPRLTKRGSELLAKARNIARLCDDFTGSDPPTQFTGTLALGAVPTVLTGVLPKGLVAMGKSHPTLLVRVTSGLSEELVTDVLSGDLDGAIVTEPLALPMGLSWHALDAEPLMVIAPHDAVGETVRELLEKERFIRFKRFAWAGQLIDSRLHAEGIQIETTTEVDSLEAIGLMVSEGLGASVVPLRAIDDPLPPNVRALPFGDPPVTRAVGVVERAANPKRATILELHAILYEICDRFRR
ncbi:MAG: LysR family transcriptional regulator [Chromatiales bacterium]|jgi:DNA-binding transcriptional LysR family regulator|nr:LysR family transcriptional regulator [Chromatiales bacterium]